MSRVAVLKGGRSLERQVSLRSGARVEDALDRLGHEVVPIDVGPDLVDRLLRERPDVAFVALHGQDGEDGTVQELLELVGVPYSSTCSDTTLPLRRIPSRISSSLTPEKFSRIDDAPRPSRYAARPGTNATCSRSARANRSVVSM